MSTRSAAEPWWWLKLRPEARWGATRLQNEVPGIRVTSGWRSPQHNAEVGGVPTSGHLDGWCTDHAGPMRRLRRAAQLAHRIGCRQTLIHDSGTGVHLHVDWRRP